MFQHQFQSQKQIITAHLAQTMTLLGMTSAELSQKIESELAKNPALEIVEEHRCPTCRRTLLNPGPCIFCSSPKNNNIDEPIVFVSSNDDYIRPKASTSNQYSIDDLPDDSVAPADDLPTHVLKQIASELQISERPLAAHVLTSLDDDGLLTVPPFEISRYHHVPVSHVERVIQLVQKADPVGVGSETPEEALLIQLKILREYKKNVPPMAEAAIQKGLTHLSRHQYDDLAKILDISIPEVEEIAQFISTNLNPYPGRAHWGDSRHKNDNDPQVYQKPDIIVKELNNNGSTSLVVEILMPMRGTLQVNSLFRQSLKQVAEDAADKLKKDLESANLFIKCIQQRNNTVQRLMKFIATFQRPFIVKGEMFLKPITRAEIADELGLHESTISRAVSGKSLQLPSGKIIPLSKFFDRSLPIRVQLKDIINSEDRPYTDSQLAKILTEKGYKIARRTVAKYRAMEGVLPAHMRKNLKKTKNTKWSTYSLSNQETQRV